jgi:hypothetical protein
MFWCKWACKVLVCLLMPHCRVEALVGIYRAVRCHIADTVTPLLAALRVSNLLSTLSVSRISSSIYLFLLALHNIGVQIAQSVQQLGYGVDDGGILSLIPGKALLYSIQVDSRTRRVFYTMSSGYSFTGPGREADKSHVSVA